MRAPQTIVGLTLLSLLLAGCGGDGDQDDAGSGEGTASPTATDGTAGGQDGDDQDDRGDEPDEGTGTPTTVEGTFEKYSSGADAVTYDESAVPEGATVELRMWEEKGDGTEFVLETAGLKPDRAYGAHIHTKPCGRNPDDAGPHYQDKADPEQPSVDPKYANDDNEVWLDFTTDAEGAASVDTDVDWLLRKDEANSLVLHAEHTKTDPGHAGMAGDRLACLNLNL